MNDVLQKRVYFIRHGETKANTTNTTQGPDSPLNEKGLEQADILAKRAQKLSFDHIISSDYDRARVTAEHVQEATKKPLELSKLFVEYRKPSEFWGKNIGELGEDSKVARGFAQMEENFGKKDWHYSDEENFFDLKERATKALEYLKNHTETNLLVVTHGNFLRILLGVMIRGEKYSPQDYKDDNSTFELFNTSISVAEFKPHWRYPEGTWQISAWNDQAHLGELT
jgi:broad specificity phosphatase PhoE